MQDIRYLNFKDKIDKKKLETVAKKIEKGGVVVFPTETVYGIGTNAFNEEAVRKIYDIKKRPLSKPISLLVNSIEMIEKIAKNITEVEYKIMESFFPGPLTIILEKKDIIPDIVTSGEKTVGIRMPDSEIARLLIQYAGVPLATPSANITGNKSGIDIKSIMKELDEGVDCYIDGGISKIGEASTIVKVIDGVPKILREGKIKENDILKVINKI